MCSSDLVKSDDTLFLTCGINPKLDFGGYGYALCNLTLPNATPESTKFSNELEVRYDWVFGANIQGMTDPQTLILSRPLVWPPNNATQTNNSK